MKRKISLALACIICLSAVPVFADNINVEVNEETVVFSDAQPVIINSRTMVPLRGVFEKLGYDIFWKADTKTVIMVSKKKDTIRITAGNRTFYKGEKEMYADVPAQIINGRMYLPLRAIGEAANLQVAWEADTKTVHIGDGAAAVNESAETEELSTQEINTTVLNLFSTAVLEGIADEYDDFTEDKGYTSQDYVNMITDFLENETVGLTAEYKQKLLTILKNNVNNPAKLSTELESFADEMENIGDAENRRIQGILDLVGDDFEDTLENILEKSASNTDLGERFENAKDTSEYAKVYSSIFDVVKNDLTSVKAETKQEENGLKLYTAMIDIMIKYLDYIQSEDFDINFVNIIL